MKFFISVILTALLSYAVCLFFPWWTIAVVAMIVCLFIPLRPGLAFLAGFTAVFLLWLGISFFISSANDHLLAHKISQIIIKTDSPALLILVTALIGGLVAGLGAFSGALLRRTK
jgi:hypothetical protein